MSFVIATNIPAINAQRTMNQSQRNLQKTYAQLASGSRITKAADDAAGLSISETLKSTIRGYQQANRNANDAISMVQVAEGGIGEISNILTRLRELGVQSASDTVGDVERGFIDKEVQQLKLEMERIAQSTRFNDRYLLNGEGETYSFQIDINNDDFKDRIDFDSSEIEITLSAMGMEDFAFDSRDGARDALEALDVIQKNVNGYRAHLGALQNRMISTSENLTTATENFMAANSRIRDTDVAESSAELARNNILSQASVAMLAQANAQPNQAMMLFG